MAARKKVYNLGAISQAAPTLTASITTFDLVRAQDTKMDIIIDLLTLNAGTITFGVFENFSDLTDFETAVTPVLSAVQRVGLANAVFPFLGKGQTTKVTAVPAGGASAYTANVYAIVYEN